METLNQLKVLIEKAAIVPEDEVKLESEFKNDLGFDSLDEIELIMECENEFDITISDNEAEKIKTVNDAVELINHLKK